MFNLACGPGHASLVPNGNIAASNFNLDVGIPQTVNMSQNPLSFLSVPPPNLLTSQHVFPSTINTNASSSFFPSNMAMRPPQPFLSSSGTNVPNFKIFQSIPHSQVQAANFNQNNIQNFGNAGFPGNSGHVIYPASFSQTGNSFNQIQNLNNDNQSPVPCYNPWSPPPSNISNFSGNAVQNCPNFQSSNRNNMWSGPSRNLSISGTSPNGSVSSKFNGSKASDINPWMKPLTSFADNSFHNYGNRVRHMQSPSDAVEHNSKECSPWKTDSNSDFKISNYRGKQHQSKWKSGNFSVNKNNQNNSSFQHSGNSFRNFHNKFQGRKNNNFKAKEDNGNKPYACDTCDRAFGVEQELKLHISEHIKCNAGNCNFEAHPKIVALHKKMQHETGYAEAINKLKDAEEIAKWRAERKRRFPTAENILKRKAEQAEKEARGEVIETKDFGKMKRPRLENRFNRRQNRRNKHFNNANVHFKNEKLLSTPKVTSNATLDSDSDSDYDSHIKLHQFPGLTYLKENPVVQKPEVIINNSDEVDSDKPVQKESDYQKILVTENNKEEKVVNSDDEDPVEIPVNTSLPVVDVFSAKEDSDEEPISEIPSRKCIEPELLESKDPEVHVINDDSEGEPPIEIPVAKVPLNEISNSDELISKDKPSDKHSRDNGMRSNRKFDRSQNKFSHRYNVMDQTPVRKSTLLEKLLADDIRHERNVIMQCVRYIVKNNFFDDRD